MPRLGMTKTEKADMERFEAEQDLRTLIEARTIRGNKSRLRRAMKMAKDQMSELERVNAEG